MNLQRCHIIPYALGGKDEASNLVLLCKRCHADGPNVEDPEIMWNWIKAYGVPFYDTFWGIVGKKEYKFIYGHSVFDDLKYILEASADVWNKETYLEYWKEKFQCAMERTGVHFGQPYLNTATMAGIYRMALKDIAKDLGVEFPKKEDKETTIPWYFE